MKPSACLILVLLVALGVSPRATTVVSEKTTATTPCWINEIDYRGFLSTTKNKYNNFIEVACCEGTNVTDWQIVSYRVRNGRSYVVQNISHSSYTGTMLHLDFYLLPLKKDIITILGAAGGVALALVHWISEKVQYDVVQFISFGRKNVTAVDGPAQGHTAADAQVHQSVFNRLGYSLQVTGDGCRRQNTFVWQIPLPSTPGQVNLNQFMPTPSPHHMPSNQPSRSPIMAPITALSLSATYYGRATREYFGIAVDCTNQWLVVGASGPYGPYPGAAYLYKIDATSQQQVNKTLLQPSALSPNAQFGYRVAVSGDVVAVAAVLDSGKGAVYNYRLNINGTANQEAKLVPSDTITNNSFGFGLDLDGDTLAVGSPYQSNNKGAVYIFQYNSSATGSMLWPQKAIISNNFTFAFNYFGQSLALQGDTLLVGSRGHAFIYLQNLQGVWQLQQELLPPSGYSGNMDFFGPWGLAVSGQTVVVGVPDPNQKGGGAMVYRFDASANSWSLQSILVASDAAVGDLFGAAVGIAKNVIIVGAHRKESFMGAAYQFVLDSASGNWSQVTKIKAATSDTWFGYSVSIQSRLVAVGGWSYSNGVGTVSLYSY